MPRLSAYLIVKNEARDLPGALSSLQGLAEEIIVVDDLSSDQTVEIAKSNGAIVYSRKLEGYGSQKQFALEHCTGDWVLNIDADERVSPELFREIRAKLAVPDSVSAPGYFLSRRMYFLGKRLRFGGVGKDWVLRFFQRSRGRYRPLEIHEQVEVDGPTERLTGSLDHYSYATLNEYLEKIPVYTTLAARQRFEEGKRFSLWHHLRPAWELFSRVFIKGAWLDGQAGLTYAALSAHAAWLRSMKLRELEHERTR